MMTEQFQWAQPWWLLLLLLLPVLAWWKGRWGQPMALRLPSTDDALVVGTRLRSRAGRLLAFLGLCGFALMICGLARPRWVSGTSDMSSSGIDIMLAIDVSGSMEALDFKLEGKPANRLEVVKNVVAKFIQQRPDDRLGMVAFAGRAYLAAPMTDDEEWIATRLKDVKIGQVEDGTAIGSAIASSVDHLRDSEAKSRIVILLTDGVNNAGSVNPLTAAEAAKAMGIKIYTIGAGTNGEAPFPSRDFFGQTRLTTMKVEIDEKLLGEVAAATGGKYFRATDTDSLEKVYSEINELETTTRKVKRYENYQELFWYFITPALLFFLLEYALSETRYRRLP